MKINYRREMKHNYMIIDPEALSWRGYECHMMTSNNLEGVLHFQLRQVDDEVRFFYEITSKQPLSRLLEGRSVRTEELRCLILGISAVLDRMEGYLLREGCVLLEPDYIYMEPESFRVWLCLVPGLERDFPEDYGKLLEYLLGKVDHQDKDSVVLAYSMYQETRKENYGMEDILRLLYSDGEKHHHKEERKSTGVLEEASEEVSEEVSFLDVQKGAREVFGREEFSKEQLNKEQFNKNQFNKNQNELSIWERIRAWWQHSILKHSGKESRVENQSENRTERQKARNLTEGFQGQRTEQHRYDESDEVHMPWELMFREEEPESRPVVDQLMGQNTVLLADLSGGTGEKKHRLHSLVSDSEDIELPYYPFVIGKQENLVDYVLSKGAVSRLHLRIDQKDNHYYVQDLNSTNGTVVCGVLLENNETVELREGDELGIAGYRYRFE